MNCFSLGNRTEEVKILQDSLEKSYQVTGAWPLKTIECQPVEATSITLLLHGYNERGLRIFRKLKRALPHNTHIVAPNGPFPLPRVKTERLDFGYAWYFYDRFTQNYHVDQELVVGLLTQLLEQINPKGLPVSIIGFSQGGYLAPLVAYAYPHTKHVVGIGCEFRTRFFSKAPKFTLTAIHGADDPLVSPVHAQKEIEALKEMGIPVSWHLIPNLKHEINSEVAEIISQL